METVVVITARIGQPSELVRALRASGFRVTLRDLAAPLEEVALDEPDLLVVDVPESEKLAEVAERLDDALDRSAEVPVVAVLARTHLAATTKTRLLSDFCLRPLDSAELVARVRRLLHRPGRGDDDRIRVGTLIVDLRGYEASVAGRVLDLTYQEFELLKFLASNPGRAFSRDQLLARVWGYDYYGGARTVDIHVRRIRAKLDHPYSALIQTIRHVGYKWTTPNPEQVSDLELGGIH